MRTILVYNFESSFGMNWFNEKTRQSNIMLAKRNSIIFDDK